MERKKLFGRLVGIVVDMDVEVPFTFVCGIGSVADVVGGMVDIFAVDVVGMVDDDVCWLDVED